VLLVFGAPCQLALLAGREHGRTIPLPVIIRPSDRISMRYGAVTSVVTFKVCSA
jgi:hypothetical protein